MEPEAVEWAIAGLRVCGVTEPVPLRNAVDLGKHEERAQQLGADEAVRAAAKRGRPRKEEGAEEKPENIRNTSHYGTSAAHLAARIKRDRPDVAERMAKGEFPSVRASAPDDEGDATEQGDHRCPHHSEFLDLHRPRLRPPRPSQARG